jgi:hypothetical protein
VTLFLAQVSVQQTFYSKMSVEYIPAKAEVAPLGKLQPNPKGRLKDQ